MLPLVIRPEAQADLLEARDWYNRQRTGLGNEFLDAVEELFDQIRTNPEVYAKTLKIVRRGKLRRFPYVAYYRMLDDRTEVLAVLHGSRDPRVWQRRAQ
jgi:plasmid stabilization system protein ParE